MKGAEAGLTLDEGLMLNANGAMAALHPTEVNLGSPEAGFPYRLAGGLCVSGSAS